jgi:hypothetical protein
MEDTLEGLATELESALDRVVSAVRELVPPPHDVFEPDGLVRRWSAALEPGPRGRLLVTLLSSPTQDSLHALARAVLTGTTEWQPAPIDVPADPDHPVDRTTG